MNRLTNLVVKCAVQYPWRTVFVGILIIIGSGLGLPYLVFNNDTRIFFGKENPQLITFESMEKIFTKNENILIALAPKDGNAFTRDSLAAVEELTRLCWRIPYSSRVDSITNFQDIKVDGDDLIVEDLVRDAKHLTDQDLDYVKKTALAEPLLASRLISPTGHVTGINVNIIKPGENIIRAQQKIALHVRKITEEFKQKHPDIDVYLTGLIMLDFVLGEASQKDMSILMPIMFGVLLIIIFLSLRSLMGTVLTVIIIACSVITGMGLSGWIGLPISAPSSNAPVIILTCSVAESIHLLITMLYIMRQGKTKEEALRESLSNNMYAMFLTSSTTVIGFLSLNFSEAPPFQHLGNMVALGVTAAYFYTILFLPALVKILPIKVKATMISQSRNPITNLGKFVVKWHNAILWGIIIIFVATSFGILKIELNDDYVRYFDKSYNFRKDSDFVMKNLTGLYTIEYNLDSGKASGISDPDFLCMVDRFASWYAVQPKVVNVNTYTDTLKRLNRKLHGDDPSYYRIPDDRNMAAQYLLLYEMSLPFGLDLNNQINIEKSSLRMVVTLTDLTTKELREADDRARAWLKANAPKSMVTHGSGLSILYAYLSDRCIKSMLAATFGDFFTIAAILVFALRNFKLGFISLIPNLTPALMAFGLWGITVGRVGIALSVLVAVTFGIIVDDTIHFLTKYNHARVHHLLLPKEAVLYAYDHVGAALISTTAILVSGFLVLSVSGFKPSSDMGMMTSLTLFLGLGMDLFFLPALLLKLDR